MKMIYYLNFQLRKSLFIIDCFAKETVLNLITVNKLNEFEPTTRFPPFFVLYSIKMSSEIPKTHHLHHPDADEKQKRLKKYDKFNTNSLRRDLLLSKFDRTLVVEKAKFEPSSNNHSNSDDNSIQSTPIIPTQNNDNISPKIDTIPDDENTLDTEHHQQNNNSTLSSPPAAMTTYALTMSPSAPTLGSMANNTNSNNASPLLTSNPLTTSHSVNDHKRRLTPVKSEVI